MIQSEVSILRRVKHPNIVLLIEEIDAHSELYLIMELVKVFQEPVIPVIPGCISHITLHCFQGGDLFDAIISSNKYTERDASCMLFNLASAIKYLHSLNIVHRDIKPENLLVSLTLQTWDSRSSDHTAHISALGVAYSICAYKSQSVLQPSPSVRFETSYLKFTSQCQFLFDSFSVFIRCM